MMLNLTDDEIRLVLNCLAEKPYRAVCSIINNILSQVENKEHVSKSANN